jgi:hypothetical protein
LGDEMIEHDRDDQQPHQPARIEGVKDEARCQQYRIAQRDRRKKIDRKHDRQEAEQEEIRAERHLSPADDIATHGSFRCLIKISAAQ